MSGPADDTTPEPLSGCGLLDQAQPVFIRSIAQQAVWHAALERRDGTDAIQLLLSPDGRVSLWMVTSYWDLRTVALAINESRPHAYERLNILPIQGRELRLADVDLEQTGGQTLCKHADSLHYDALIDSQRAQKLLALLVDAQRPMTRISQGVMKAAVQLSEEEGCFTVADEPSKCGKCGEVYVTEEVRL